MIHFTKMQGIGNDYIYINGFEEPVPDPAALAVRVSDRHFGVGADGLVLILPSETADFRMRMFNADGSEGKMCGNASRCIAKYVYERGLTDKQTLTLETLSGVKTLRLNLRQNRVESVQVEMGQAIFDPRRIPVSSDLPRFVEQPLSACGQTFSVSCVSMGNPHAVVFADDPLSLDLPGLGPLFENHPLFPERINTEFIRLEAPDRITMRVWERGSGETLACGTGACASAAVCALLGKSPFDTDITVSLLGGELKIRVLPDFRVLMTGPAAFVCDGTIAEE